jgi:hypothetical protein
MLQDGMGDGLVDIMEAGMEGQEAKVEHWGGVLVAPSLDDGWECLEKTL